MVVQIRTAAHRDLQTCVHSPIITNPDRTATTSSALVQHYETKSTAKKVSVHFQSS